MTKQYVVIQDGIDFWIELQDKGILISGEEFPTFMEAKKHLKKRIKEAITQLKVDLKAVGSLRKDQIA